MSKLIDLTGLRFGRLVVARRGTNSNNGHPRWDCVCDCGGRTTATLTNLKKGRTQSCGCLQRERTGAAAKISSATHRMTKTAEHRSWSAMRSRCLNPNATGYERWGGRGITITKRWDKFENFLADMGPRPSPSHTLDRIDKDGNYEPDNCRWATKLEQANNRRDNEMIVINGTSVTLRNALRDAGSVISIDQARRRIRKGWPPEAAVSTPPMR
jgi:hypothetical protein